MTPMRSSHVIPLMFRSAPPCGERQPKPAEAAPVEPFRSAPPCGERLDKSFIQHDPEVFRSAPPCGERHVSATAKVTRPIVSIRAPVRGATYVFHR